MATTGCNSFGGTATGGPQAQADGKVNISEGTYRVEGDKILFKSARGRENSLQVGMRGDQLVIRAFGAGTVFKREGK